MTDLPLYAVLDQYRRLAGFTVEDCWSAYFALGGRAAPEALQAFLAGQAALPAAETDIIAVAISEFQLGEVSASLPSTGQPEGNPTKTPLNFGVETTSQVFPASPAVDLDSAALLLPADESLAVDVLPNLHRVEDPSAGRSLLRIDDGTHPTWELHLAGDEIVILLSGRAEVATGRLSPVTTSLERPHQAHIIPRGHWHYHQAVAPHTKLLYLTPLETAR